MSDLPESGVQLNSNRWDRLKKLAPKLGIGFVLLLAIYVVFAIWAAPTYDGPTSRVLVTSSKITGLDGYTRVFSSDTEDYAIYVKDEYSAAQLPMGMKVQVGAYSGTVSETHDAYFVIRGVQSSSPILPGTTVYRNNDAVGFVSSQAAGLLTCRYY